MHTTHTPAQHITSLVLRPVTVNPLSHFVWRTFIAPLSNTNDQFEYKTTTAQLLPIFFFTLSESRLD